MGETLRTYLFPKNKTVLSSEESNWLHSFNISDLDTTMARRPLEVQEIRMDHSQFEIWMKQRKLFKLFFDGASKENPWVSGGGRVIIFLKGNTKSEYYCNTGIDTNNMAEAYGIWQGLRN